MDSAEPEPRWESVKEILGYFVRNPKAADSLEGVARWRVLEEQVHRSLEQTEAALTWLVSEGYLQEVKTVGSGRVFRLDPGRQASAARFVASLGLPRDKAEL